jgi:hypothetical protein
MKVKIVDNSLVIPKELLKINNVNKVVPVEGLYGYEFKISLIKNEEKEEIYSRLNQEINTNTSNSKVIYYSEKHLYDLNNLFAYAWVIKYYYLEDYVLYLPINEGTSLINIFNEKIIKNEKYYLPDNFLIINLENLSNNGNINLLIGGCDISLRDLVNINKRRINTIFKSALKRVIIFSVSNLNNFEVFNSFEKIKVLPYFEKSNNNNFIITDSINSEEDLLELVNDNSNNNRIYINVDLPSSILKSVFNKLILKEINVVKKNPDLLIGPGIVIEKSIPSIIDINSFDIIIFKLPIIRDYLDIIPFLKIFSKNNNDIQFILDEKSMDTLERCIYNLISELPQESKINLIDSSIEYPDYQSLLNEINSEFINATEKWIILEPSQKIKNLDLSNLSNTDYETIRNYVKFKLFKMESLDINTCQLCTPSSPNNRSKNILIQVIVENYLLLKC